MGSFSLERFDSVLPKDEFERLMERAAQAKDLFEGLTNWHVNSTSRGGGVAEMLEALLPYARGAGVDAGWVFRGATPDFSNVTKRIHTRLPGARGAGGPLGED